jgi:hypothetical protein
MVSAKRDKLTSDLPDKVAGNVCSFGGHCYVSFKLIEWEQIELDARLVYFNCLGSLLCAIVPRTESHTLAKATVFGIVWPSRFKSLRKSP